MSQPDNGRVPRPRQAVSKERFLEVLGFHARDLYTVHISGWRVPIIHGLMALMMRLPGLARESPSVYTTIARIRKACLQAMRGWGFSEEEIDWLDHARELMATGDYFQDDQPPPTTPLPIQHFDREVLTEIEAHSRFPTGIGRIERGECPMKRESVAACMVCSYGHMLECHYPQLCAEARCSHYAEGN